MNAERRKRLDQINIALQEQLIELNNIREEEQDYLDNMPEDLQLSAKAEQAQEAIEAIDEMDGIESSIEEARKAITELVLINR